MTASGGPGTGNSFSWYKNGLILIGQSGNSVNVNIDGLGNYTLKVTNATGCTSTSNTVSISDSSNGKLFIYPNPSTGKFQVRFFSDINNIKPRKIAIYDAKGSLVQSASYVIFGAYTSIAVDLGSNSAGLYYIYLMDNDGNKLATERVFIYK